MILTARRAAIVAALCLLAAVPSAMAAAGTSSAPQHTLATTTLSHFKVELVATEGPVSGGVPEATVTAIGYEPAGSGWKKISAKTIGQPDQWFWNSVDTCSLTVTQIKQTASGAVNSDGITVSLLTTPAIGCSKSYAEHWNP